MTRKYRFLFFIFTMGLCVQIHASPHSRFAKTTNQNSGGVASSVQKNQALSLELGEPIERDFAGGQSHSYQMTLAAGQYVSIVAEQRGIDVVVKLFGPDSKLIAGFDSEMRLQGVETVSWVAEEGGNYRLDILARYGNAPAGRYEIKVVELRVANDNDRSLYESLKSYTKFLKLLYTEGKYDEALLAGERALEIREKVLGYENPAVAQILNDLATLYFITGEYAKAESLNQMVLKIRERVLGAEHPAVAQTLTNIANLYNHYRDEYTRVEGFYERALDIFEKTLEPQHIAIAQTLGNLAQYYSERGDYAKAEPLFQRALPALEKGLGPEHPSVAIALSNLGLLYSKRGDYAKAEPIFERALNIYTNAFGPQHPYVGEPLNCLAMLYRDGGDYAKAEPLFQRALSIWEKSLGPNHVYVARVLCNLAVLYRKSGDYAKAEPLYDRALTIVENALGPDHPYVSEILHDYSIFYAAKGELAKAITLSSRANDIDERNFAFYLDIGSERQKLAYLDTFTKWTNFTVSLQSQSAPNDPKAIDLAFTTLLRRKARGLDAMTDNIATLRTHATPENKALFDKLKDARSRLATLVLKEPDAARPDVFRKRVSELNDEVEKLEGDLSLRSAEFRAQRQPVTISAIQAALPRSSALVEFAYFEPIDAKTEKLETAHYLAYVLTPQGQPRWVDLGEAAPIDQAIDVWRKALRNPYRSDVTRLARTLDEKVMRPVRALLNEMQADTQHLMIAPDGSLNLIPFTALVDENDKYLIERYCVSYLTSGRDLLRLQTSQPSRNAPLLIANPDFGRITMLAMRGIRRRKQSLSDPSQVYFPPLPATDDEAQAIKALLPNASLLTQDAATETAVKQSHGPQILHIATHGFFIDYQQSQSAKERPNNSTNNINAPGINVLASTQSTPYTVQLEASPAFDIAQEKVRRLKGQGVDAYIIKSQVKGKGTFYRVRVGNFPTMNDAQKFGADLRGRGVAGEFFITRYEQPQPEIAGPAPLVASASANPSRNSPADLRLSRMAANIENPLLRSGLALAGANQGKSGDDDGILTALEVADLDLSGTKLVVLSACDTGIGEVKNGEGVQGLRRALVLAGSESQVMSLWPVSDEATKDLMIPYYKALQHGEGRSEGLRQVQLRILHGRKDRQHPFYWAAFIQSGEWANLTGQR